MKFSSSALLLLASSLTVGITESQETAPTDDALSDWVSALNQTVSEIVGAFEVIVGCESDAEALGNANPALADAYLAYVATYSYQTTTVTDGSSRMDSSTTTYDSDALATYKAACEAVGETAGWMEQPPTTYSCLTDTGDYSVAITCTNWGLCYPTTDACQAYGEGYLEVAKSISDQWAADGLMCTVDDAVVPAPSDGAMEAPATESPAGAMAPGDAVEDPTPADTTATEATATAAPVTPTETSETPSDDSSASMMISSLPFVVAAVVGTALYL